MTWFNDTGGLRAARPETRDAPRSLAFAFPTVCAIDPAGPTLWGKLSRSESACSASWTANSVVTPPGAMYLARMPRGASSNESDSVKPTTANLVALQSEKKGTAIRPPQFSIVCFSRWVRLSRGGILPA